VLRARAAMAEPLGEGAREFEQLLSLRRDAERSPRARRRGREALDDASADALPGAAERRQRAASSSGCASRPRREVLGSAVMVPDGSKGSWVEPSYSEANAPLRSSRLRWPPGAAPGRWWGCGT
jgi:hypothetical protein